MAQRVTKKQLAELAKLIHPDLQLLVSDPRGGKRYSFGRVVDGCVIHLCNYMSANELLGWFDGFYNRRGYENALRQLVDSK